MSLNQTVRAVAPHTQHIHSHTHTQAQTLTHRLSVNLHVFQLSPSRACPNRVFGHRKMRPVGKGTETKLNRPTNDGTVGRRRWRRRSFSVSRLLRPPYDFTFSEHVPTRSHELRTRRTRGYSSDMNDVTQSSNLISQCLDPVNSRPLSVPFLFFFVFRSLESSTKWRTAKPCVFVVSLYTWVGGRLCTLTYFCPFASTEGPDEKSTSSQKPLEKRRSLYKLVL